MIPASNTPRPVLTFQGGAYVVMFTALDEDMSARKHFMHECGWTEREFNRIRDFAWFNAHVALFSVAKGGAPLADAYLGACCYKTEAEFHTRFAGDYFADMVHECAKETDNAALIAEVSAWRTGLREKDRAAQEARALSARKPRRGA